jgi:O-antigen ligase
MIAAVIILFIRYKEPLYLMAIENENISNNGEIGEHIMSVSNLNSDASNLERINRWSCALRMFEDRPVTGFGPGTYQFVYGPYQSVYEMTHISTVNGDKGNAHSEPLTYLSETGLPGFISFLLWMFATVGFGMRAYYRARDKYLKNIILAALLGFMTFFFHGLVNSFIDQVKMASLVFGSIAIIVVADLAGKSKLTVNETKEVY